MTTESETLSLDDEMSALLAWYVSGRLDAADKARVEAYAQANPAFAHQIALAREEADTVFAVNQEITVPTRALDTLKSSMAAKPSQRLADMKSSIVDRVGGWLSDLRPRQLAYAGMAAALAIAVQAASIGALLSPSTGDKGYQTASSGAEATASGIFALVTFKNDATSADMAALLTEQGARIVDGPRAGGVYRVRLGAVTMTDAQIEAAIEGLAARSDIVGYVARSNAGP